MPNGLPNGGDERVAKLLHDLGVSKDFRISESFVSEALGLLVDQPHTLDLKIASAAVTEMRDAFAMFAPFKNIRKVTIFGSARTSRDDPLYAQTRQAAKQLADAGWMVVTGAGPGIMQAGMEGAGRERSIGVSIRLPWETSANSVIAGDAKHVSMKYFFTRKLMLVKESSAFVCMPGGFGTLDETFELLTLTQTGKGVPVPIVFLDVPGDEYWEAVDEFVEQHLVARGFVNPVDRTLYTITDSCDVAVDEVTRFYANYHSIRIVGDDLLIRVQRGPDDEQLADLNARFGHLSTDGRIRRAEPFGIERRQDDHLELARVALGWNHRGYAELRTLVDALNQF